LQNQFDTSQSLPFHTQSLHEEIITEICHIKTDVYYDLHVPGLNNYAAHGFVNHNSGKTFCGARLGEMLCQKWGPKLDGARFLSGAATYGMLFDTTIPEWINSLEASGLVNGLDFTFLKTPRPRLTIHAWNDVEVLFRSLDNHEKLRSLNVFASQIEEGSLITRKAFTEVLQRTRQQYRPDEGAASPDVNRIYIHTNPQVERGWIYEMFVEKGGYHQDWNERRQRWALTRFRRVIAPTVENIHLGTAYLLNLKTAHDEEGYKMFVLGQDGNFKEGLLMKGFTDENVQNVEHDPERRLHLSCDFNVDPMSWVLFHRDGEIYQYFDELVIENTNIDQTLEEFMRRYPAANVKNGITLNGDANSGRARSDFSDKANDTRFTSMQRLLRQNGYNDVKIAILKGNPPIDERVRSFNAKVCNFNGEVFIHINPRCKYLLKNMYSLKYKEGTSIIDLPTPNDISKDKSLKFLGHIFDAASYPVHYYDPIGKTYKDFKNKPVYKSLGFEI
jgi:hypothetical protein